MSLTQARANPGPLLLAIIILPVAAASDDALPDDRPPNIVILLADDLGYGEVGGRSDTGIPTPNIDSIGAQGVRFTNGYVTAPNCSPSRAGLLTGRIQTRFGYEFNPVGARNENSEIGIPRRERTLAELLHDAGYVTSLVGKWHLGGTAAYHPMRHGFDEFFGFLHEGHFFVPPPWRGVTTMLRRRTLPGGGTGRHVDGHLIYSTHMGHDEPPYDADNPILRGGQPVMEPAYLTDAFTREAVDFIDRHAGRPFFLYLAYNAVHSPLQGNEAHMLRMAHIGDIHRRIFAAMLSSLDDSVGAVLQKLREEKLDERTLVFFLSDNGGPTRELTSSNQPLRGEKGQVYEGGIRVPFMVRWKGVVPAGAVYDPPVLSTDIYATAAAAAAVTASGGIDGVDLLPYLRGEEPGRPHDVLYWRQGTRTALRSGDWKLLRVRSGGPGGGWELYDLSSDVGETRDLAPTQPDRLEELKKTWEAVDATMAEPRF